MTKRIIAVFVCLFSLFLITSCEKEKDHDVISNFTSYIGSIEEVGDNFKCLLVLEPLEGYFKENVNNNEIYFEAGFKDVSNIEIISNTKDKIELYFTIVRNVEDSIDFNVEGIVKLGDGVLLDINGDKVGEVAIVQTYVHPASKIQSSKIHEFDQLQITLNHRGAYVAEYYVTWTEVTGWKDFIAPYDRYEMYKEFLEMNYEEKLKYATPVLEEKSWELNGKNVTAGFKHEILIKPASGCSAYNVRITARAKTGLIWNPWNVVCDQHITNNTVSLTIGGTTLNPNYDLDQKNYRYDDLYIDEVIDLIEFNSVTDEGKVRCSAVLGFKRDDLYFSGEVNIKLSDVSKELIIVNLDERSRTVSFEFEVDQSKWNENGNVLGIFILSGISESFDDPYRELTVFVK